MKSDALGVWLWARPDIEPEAESTITWAGPGCAEALEQPGEDLAFEPFDREWSNADFTEMRLYLLCSLEDIELLEGILAGWQLEPLAAVDFEQHVVLVLFDGLKDNLCPGVAIERVRLNAMGLVVCAQRWGEHPNQGCAMSLGNPYDIVLVPREERSFVDTPITLCTRPVPSPGWPGE